jgi:transposase
LEEAEEMMTQEEYMNVKALHAGGWTIKQIAEHLGFHPATVSSWLKNGGPPPKRSVPENELVIDERWRGRVAQLLAHNGDLQGSSIMRVIQAEGYEGSYQTLTRYLHSVRGPTRGAVAITMRIETMPGEEFQFDWSDCNTFARRWGWEHELHCFGAVLCWSRFKHWWFAPSIDQPHTFEGLVRFFEAAEGVASVGRTDRMGQLGQTRSKGFVFHPVALSFARHYDVALKACDAGDAKRKGKVERPFRDLKRGFLSEMDLDPPDDIGELNRRAPRWLERYVHAVVHGTTKETPAARLAVERPLLGHLPPVRFDTSRRETRRVGRVPLVEWDTVYYSAPPTLAGKLVEVRQPIGYNVIELRFLGELMALHFVAPPGSAPQWLPEHKSAAEAIVLGRRRLGVLADAPVVASNGAVATVDLGEGDYDVAVPDLAPMAAIGPAPDLQSFGDIAGEGITADGFERDGGAS